MTNCLEKGRGSFLDMPFLYPPQKPYMLRQLKKMPNFLKTNTADRVFYKMKLAFGLILISSVFYYLFSRKIVTINL